MGVVVSMRFWCSTHMRLARGPGCSECPHTVQRSCPGLYLVSEPFIWPCISRTVFCMSRTVSSRKSLLFEFLKPLTVTKRLQKRLQMFVTCNGYKTVTKTVNGYKTVTKMAGPAHPQLCKKLPRATVQENHVTVF